MRPYYQGLVMLLCIATACKKDKTVVAPADTVGANYIICAQDSWVNNQEFESFHTNITFVHNNKAYVPQYSGATGYPGSNLVHIFDGTAWTETPCSIPFNTVHCPFYFTIGSKGYAAVFPSFDDPCKFYEYNILTNTWTRKADFPGEASSGSASFTVNGKGYVVGGDDWGDYTNENWEYNPTNNTWTKRKGLLLNRAYGRGFSIGSKGYVVNGRYPDDLGYLHSLSEYDPATDKWTNRAALPGEARTSPAVFVIDGKAYAGGGMSDDNGRLTDFYRYNAAADLWTRMENIPSIASYAVSFALNGKGYVTWSKPPSPPGIPSGMARYNPEYCTNVFMGTSASSVQ